MRYAPLALAALTIISLAAADSLEAQRRTSGGSGGSSTPSSGGSSSGGSRSSGGSSGGSSAGSRDRGSSGGGSVSRPSSAPSSRGDDRARPAAAPRDRDSGSRPAASSSGGSGRSGSSAGSGTRAARGKIGSVRTEAERSRRRGGKVLVGGPVFVGGCYSCDYWGWYGGRWGWYGGGWWYPSPHYHPEPSYGRDDDSYEGEDEGYDDYPYASNEEGATFVRGQARNRGFGTLSAQYFSDFGSDVSAGRLGFEGVFGKVRFDADYAHYAEPVAAGTDRMQTFRAGLGFQPRLGDRAYGVVGIGGRGLWINQGGGSAGGPEGTLGLQVFPFKPLGVNVTGRLAGMQWSDGGGNFAMTELTTTGSVFLGRAEIQGGWHWLKIEGAPAFGGPVVGVRMWF